MAAGALIVVGEVADKTGILGDIIECKTVPLMRRLRFAMVAVRFALFDPQT